MLVVPRATVDSSAHLGGFVVERAVWRKAAPDTVVIHGVANPSKDTKLAFVAMGVAIAATCVSGLDWFHGRWMMPHHWKQKVRYDIIAIHAALIDYSIDHDGKYPASLSALVTPDERGRRYLDQSRVPRDPWNREYVYLHGMGDTLLTYGRDGIVGGTGDDADIDYESIVSGR